MKMKFSKCNTDHAQYIHYTALLTRRKSQVGKNWLKRPLGQDIHQNQTILV